MVRAQASCFCWGPGRLGRESRPGIEPVLKPGPHPRLPRPLGVLRGAVTAAPEGARQRRRCGGFEKPTKLGRFPSCQWQWPHLTEAPPPPLRQVRSGRGP